ncbi:MAG: DUF167 domain-containing protein [Candidatus Thorarchaeota archaeon]|nr:DUF167 domain-containing protein [Candidatus Thorarchaeota archaeon]
MLEKMLWEGDNCTFLRITVRPNSGQRELIHILSETEFVVNLKAPAREGKANTELVKRISKALSISSSDVTLVGGQKSKEKTLMISGMNATDVWHTLNALHKR